MILPFFAAITAQSMTNIGAETRQTLVVGTSNTQFLSQKKHKIKAL